ncbi:hypothetical protein Talka_00423 [Tepidimonas alkaliphilus]|uniref:Phage-related protein n=1 Tax=Tepidimonas alkaliphilus TaxID=2588942 RepID=A0A554WB17_9BURK|nr:type II toxin-antitoxin system RelE/ParE family toxin [Tepidimonas alkaliphilus]TSE20760.1 hypothetical protein Talka_00423 [Tepidimonas alkaliphilus]
MAWTMELLPEAEAELLALPADVRAHFLHVRRLLLEFGPQQVGMPYVRPVHGKLWEMRLRGRDGIARALYVARSGQRLLVLHVFVKKTDKTPRRAIETALQRLRRVDDEQDPQT